MPGIAASGAASSSTVAAARHTRPASARRPGERAPPDPSFTVIAASGSRERMSRSGLSTATTAASIPPPAAIATLCSAHDSLRADRERQREEGRFGVKQVDRQLLAQRQPQRAGDHAQHEPVDQQHRDHRARRVAVAAQLGDQPPALRDGQQHRVEREQKPDQRADRGEQGARLVDRRGGLREQLFVVVGALDVQAPGGEHLERRPHAGFRAGGGRHEDPAHAALQARHFLCEEQRRDRDRARGQGPDLLR